MGKESEKISSQQKVYQQKWVQTNLTLSIQILQETSYKIEHYVIQFIEILVHNFCNANKNKIL